MLRALEDLRTEHRRALEIEEERRAQEAARMDAWIQDSIDSHQVKEALNWRRSLKWRSRSRKEVLQKMVELPLCQV